MTRKAHFNWTSLLLLPVLLATNWLAVGHHHRGCGDSGCEISHQSDASPCACEHHAVTSTAADSNKTLILADDESGITGSSHCLICSLLSTHLSTPAVVFDWSPVAVVDTTTATTKAAASRQFSGFYRSRAPPANS
ncbi:MAG: DUF2946 family protein [Pirellulaceae bacterium]